MRAAMWIIPCAVAGVVPIMSVVMPVAVRTEPVWIVVVRMPTRAEPVRVMMLMVVVIVPVIAGPAWRWVPPMMLSVMRVASIGVSVVRRRLMLMMLGFSKGRRGGPQRGGGEQDESAARHVGKPLRYQRDLA